MLTMLFGTSRIDKDVIDKDNDKLIQHFHKHLVHEVHEIDGSIGYPEWHHCELVLSITSHEGCLRHVS
jgi:hypothetical protein